MNTSFSNPQMNNDTLPQLDVVVFEPLHKKYKKVVMLTTLISTIIIVALGACGYYLPLGEEALLLTYKEVVLGGSVCLAVIIAVLRIAGVNKKGYAIRQHDISYKTGLINQVQITIPFNRVQHVEIYEGFLLRLFGLSQIEFFTAGGSLGDLKIPGLPLVQADKIKAFVIEQLSPTTIETQVEQASTNLNTEE